MNANLTNPYKNSQATARKVHKIHVRDISAYTFNIPLATHLHILHIDVFVVIMFHITPYICILVYACPFIFKQIVPILHTCMQLYTYKDTLQPSSKSHRATNKQAITYMHCTQHKATTPSMNRHTGATSNRSPPFQHPTLIGTYLSYPLELHNKLDPDLGLQTSHGVLDQYSELSKYRIWMLLIQYGGALTSLSTWMANTA